MGRTFVLSAADWARAREVAQRHEWKRKTGVPDAHGAGQGQITPEMEFGGAAAELFAAVCFGVPWTCALPGAKRGGPDIGRRTQVRHVYKPTNRCLTVRPCDWDQYGDVPYVLVRRTGERFTVLKWAMASEVKARGRWTNYGCHGRPYVWSLHQKELREIEELTDV